MMHRLLILCAALCLSACATLNGVPQTPCQRAERGAATAHAAVNVAELAGANAAILAKLNDAAIAADAVATGICAAHPG